MANCPKCGHTDAYIGFNSVECLNMDCENFVITCDTKCPCCGGSGHVTKNCAVNIKRLIKNANFKAAYMPGRQPGKSTLLAAYVDFRLMELRALQAAQEQLLEFGG